MRTLFFGAVIDDRLQGEVRITVIATGFTQEAQPQAVGKGAAAPAKPRSISAPAVSPNPVQPAAEPQKPGSGGLDIPEFLRSRRKPQ